MIYNIIVNPFAELEIKEAKDWYNYQKKELGNDLILELKKTVERIKNNPFQFPIVRKEIRRAILNRFPYSIFFIVDSTNVNIFAFFHNSRNPIIWKNRFTF